MTTAFFKLLIDSSVTEHVPKERVLGSFQSLRDTHIYKANEEHALEAYYNEHFHIPRAQKEEELLQYNMARAGIYETFVHTKKSAALHTLVTMKHPRPELYDPSAIQIYTKYSNPLHTED